jgi:hypothetical protein
MGGSDDSSNLIELTVEEHAEAHRALYEQYGKWEDKVAWLSLSKQISCAEATKMAQSLANSGEKNRMYGMIGELNPNYKNRGENSPLFGKKQPIEWQIKKRKALIGRKMTVEQIQKMKGPKTEAHIQKLRVPKQKTVCRILDKREMSLCHFMNWNKKYV